MCATLRAMISSEKLNDYARNPKVLAWVWILLLSYFTYFHNYSNPPQFFWDENYHVSSAQKYINGVYFMEPHPPLGKLLIAAGELLLKPNATNHEFVGTDYARNPKGAISFVGYRFFPTLLGWMIAPMLFGIFLLLTKDYLISVVLSFLYLFDNALIVHSRSAMLESTLLFFAVALILLFLLLMQHRNDTKKFRIFSVLFGCAFAAILTTKANGLIMVLLIPSLLWYLWPHFRQIVEFLVLQSVAFLVIFCSVWYVHFAVGSTVNHGLPNAGYYQASDEYVTILQEGGTASLASFPVMLRDSLAFLPHYERGVPELNLCKIEENGSPWFMWPVGARAINYRWETPGTPPVYKYLYLQSNPVVWFFGLSGVILSIALLSASVLLPLQRKLQYAYPMCIFLGVYVSYMIAVSRIDRVMYLYHYFIPLVISFLLFGLVLMEIRNIGPWSVSKTMRNGFALFCGLLIFAGYQFYRPLTYYEPITDEAFEKRRILRLWDLRCVRCERDNPLVNPLKAK